jgi:hypothetical protein
MGLITKNMPQIYKIFAALRRLAPVNWQIFDEMHCKMIKESL